MNCQHCDNEAVTQDENGGLCAKCEEDRLPRKYMEPSRARDILHAVWGNMTAIEAATVREIEAVALEGETLLQTCARIGEVPQVLRVPAFDHKTMRRVLRA